MFLEIPDLLTAHEIAELVRIGGGATFVDGRISNPHNKAKDNRIIADGEALQRSAQLLAAGLTRNERFARWAFPKTIATPRLTRYVDGGNYGVHSDAAFMAMGPGRPPLRADLSCTIFLTAPDSYDGGELVIHLGSRALAVKGPAGSAIVYPSSTLHEVRPVTRGDRLVGLTFIESRIADPHNRDLLHELNEVAALEGLKMDWANYTRLQRVQNGLTRLWADG